MDSFSIIAFIISVSYIISCSSIFNIKKCSTLFTINFSSINIRFFYFASISVSLFNGNNFFKHIPLNYKWVNIVKKFTIVMIQTSIVFSLENFTNCTFWKWFACFIINFLSSKFLCYVCTMMTLKYCLKINLTISASFSSITSFLSLI